MNTETPLPVDKGGCAGVGYQHGSKRPKHNTLRVAVPSRDAGAVLSPSQRRQRRESPNQPAAYRHHRQRAGVNVSATGACGAFRPVAADSRDAQGSQTPDFPLELASVSAYWELRCDRKTCRWPRLV